MSTPEPGRATPIDIKPRSRDVTDGFQKAPARAMLRAVGMGDDDWEKPQIGIASAWNEVTPCNMTLQKLAKQVKAGVFAAGGFPMEFGTITVSDGISMGHEGMRASLVSREVITDSVETVVHAERLDGFVGLAGCDKSIPAMLMAAARLDLASVFVYNGSILPGHHNGVSLDITSVFEAVGARALGKIDDAELDLIERRACPARARAVACSPPTRCRRSPRRSASACRARRRRRPSTADARTTRCSPGTRSWSCSARASPPARS